MQGFEKVEETFATTSNPLVPLSNLCTIPGRIEDIDSLECDPSQELAREP